jgi:sigma-B regulation protein RsbU (phosphoserine phosphatase)
MAMLVGIGGLTTGREYPVGELCIVGRSPNAHVRLPDLEVSRQHAKITRVDNGFIIEDLESGYGTIVNDHYITVSHLRPNDEITICGFRFRFRFEDGPMDRVRTSEFKLVYNEGESRVVSVDASRFTRFQPVTADQRVETIAKLTRRLNAILAVGQAASRCPEPKDLLDEVMGCCLEVFPDADRAMVASPDREKQSLVVQASALRKGVEVGGFNLSRNVISDVLYKGHSVVTSADQTGKGGGTPGGQISGAMMVAPLICQGQMLGLVYVDRLKPEPSFSEQDLEVLTGMAAHMALAMHSAQLRESLMARSKTEQELSAAHEVQKRFLPRGVPKMGGFTFVAHYDPCRDVGGDLYDFIRLDAGRLGIVIGDVSGKGFAAALVMAWVASQLRVAAHLERHPADVLARVNEGLLEAHQDDLFVTLIYGVLDRWKRTFRFCNAGHVPPLVRRGLTGDVEVVEAGTGMPVGVVPDASFEEDQVALEQGDTVLLVTDGVTEAMNPQRQMFGIEGLSAAMALGVPPATNVVSDVLGELRRFVGGETQYDDITMVAVGVGTSVEDVTTTLPPGYLRTEYFKNVRKEKKDKQPKKRKG